MIRKWTKREGDHVPFGGVLFERASWGRALLGSLAGAGLLLACGTRSESWDAPFHYEAAVLLEDAVALHDVNLERVLFVQSPAPEQVKTQSTSVGKNVTALLASVDKKQLFVLSSGEFPRRTEEDEKPRLQIFNTGDWTKSSIIELDDPKQKLALDPEGEWVVAYVGDATVMNPNELLFVQLGKKEPSVTPKTIRSRGGAPEELFFTPPLTLADGAQRRFLVVRTDRDATLIDLSDLSQKEITLPAPQDNTDLPHRPAQIIADDGDAEDPTDARIALRFEGSPDVVLWQLNPPRNKEEAFYPEPNLVDVGGVPSTIDFVRTDGGLRLAALVPSRQLATLVDPRTTVAEQVELKWRYTQMRRITNVVSDLPEGGDVALLWGEGRQMAFWSLGATSSRPYRSIDPMELDLPFDSVLDVPAPHAHWKVLVGDQAEKFYVLDLKRRESFPLHTKGRGFQVQVAQDGKRLWIFRPETAGLSMTDLNQLHPTQLYVEPAPLQIFDIARADGGRAALLFHSQGSLDVTLLDAEKPDSASSSYFPGLHWEGIQ